MSSPNPPQNIIFTFLSQQSVHSSSKPSLFLSSLKTLPCCPISIENKLTPVFKTYLLSKSTSKHDLFFSPNEASPLPQNPPYFWALSVQKVEQQPRLATLRSQKSLRGIQREFLTNWPISICGGTFCFSMFIFVRSNVPHYFWTIPFLQNPGRINLLRQQQIQEAKQQNPPMLSRRHQVYKDNFLVSNFWNFLVNWCASDTSFHFYTAIFNSLMLEASMALV